MSRRNSNVDDDDDGGGGDGDGDYDPEAVEEPGTANEGEAVEAKENEDEDEDEKKEAGGASTPPEGTWKKNDNGGRYLVWHGAGVPCVTCVRLWAVTTGHMHSGDICPCVCTQAFSHGRAPTLAPSAPPNPLPLSAWPPAATPQAHVFQEIEAPPQDGAAPPAAMMSIRVHTVPPPETDVQLPTGWVPGVAGPYHVGEVYHDLQPSTLTIHQHDDDEAEDWPAFRDSPMYVCPTNGCWQQLRSSFTGTALSATAASRSGISFSNLPSHA
ncbi:hypothetical protein CYMTET_50311 [Cymbomonas tetramitiformis]|uniref:Uncharacterized protein n=1 Tax=Cymbomonas tetramitiformis TaxID=36881 RepID=A0AAE0ET88_9CHLO|nr:hypothetical protein CYMTET_50311 [Cymbomonas tetramitiformis]